MLRKFLLTAHITLAVGWIGAVAAYLVLVASAMTSDSQSTLRAAWIAMELIGWYLIVPLALTSLLTGCVVSLSTPWGLFRHYWVLISLVLTLFATAVLLRHMLAVSVHARAAAAPGIADVGVLRSALWSELLHAGVGLLVLIAIEALNVFKPQGLTAYGRRRPPQVAFAIRSAAEGLATSTENSTRNTPRWVHVFGFHAIGLALLLAILHLAGGGMSHH